MATKPKATEKVVTVTYNSIGDFQRAVAACPKRGDDDDSNNPDFYGTSHNQAMTDLLKGNLRAAATADALMDKLADESMVTAGMRIELSVAGYSPCVPAYLSGEPECMYANDDVTGESEPIRIFASICVSSGVSIEQLEKRGVTILALCQKLIMFRPVELYVYADTGGMNTAIIPVVKIETSPLDLATATYALTAPGFLRRLCFRWAMSNGWDSGEWAWARPPHDASAMARTRKALGMTDADLHISGAHLHDPLVKRPVEWINEQILKYSGGEVETA